VPVKINITVLVAPLDWGLGHATRCIPIIKHLIQSGCNVIIAAEGAQEKLLKTEFPLLKFVHLPGYHIDYAKDKRFFSLKIIQQLPKILLAIKKEKKWLKDFASKQQIDVVISDNRYGLFNKKIKSVFITHQLLIKAPLPFVEKMFQFFNYRLIQNFNECWVPDFDGTESLAGILSHPSNLPSISTNYVGALSRFEKHSTAVTRYDLLVVISGPEPQRSVLEEKLLAQLQDFDGTALLVRGLPQSKKTLQSTDRIRIENHLNASALEQAFAETELVISRSGYTTVMDICKMNKKAILIPTPGQTEQEYLAKHLEKAGFALAAVQQHFVLTEQLNTVKKFNFKSFDLDMERYKIVLDRLIEACRKAHTITPVDIEN